MDNVLKSGRNNSVLDLIWNNTADAIFTMGHDGSITSANPAFEDMLGWKVGDLEGIAYPPFISDMTKEEHRELLTKLQDGQDFPYSIMKRKHKDGKILNILASYRAIKDEEVLAVGMYKDFTEQMVIQKKLQESEYCYRTLVEYLPETIIKQRNGRIDFINSSGVQLFGRLQPEDIIGYSIWDFISSNRRYEIQKMIDTVYENNQWNNPTTIVDKFIGHDGTKIWTEVKIIPVGSKEEPDIQLVIRDVTEKKRYESQLEFLAYHDSLTGLKDRRIFTQIVNESIETAEKTNETIAIMYIDIDKFKSINDTFGHHVGDKLLQQFAERLKGCVRENDVLCRVGGDEFLVLLKGIKDKNQLADVAKRMQSAFQRPYQISENILDVTSSIGIAVFPKDGLKSRSLIHHADQALYRAKENRNQYVFYG
ncbi:sensor domain-containing diguanylate cyclase [Oceanobacillus saliphilus]|uniref:sensor domain-containing diguanylate cyclase n=1 Tax=Oceanobacillus saliphilus TaxID=2925834 RepID=UPI00201DE688|nr:sensor domain-containing diguanylate cyclase [Oceanobacillus saliphilus]